MAVRSHDVKQVRQLVATGLRRGSGIWAIWSMLYAAACGLYKPKGYEEEEMLKGLLLLRLGGPRVAHIGHRALGTPSVSTL